MWKERYYLVESKCGREIKIRQCEGLERGGSNLLVLRIREEVTFKPCFEE